METANKILGWILVSLAILAVIALIAVTFFLDAIVKKGIVTVGPKLTQTSIELKAVHISLITGSAKMTDLVIGNPTGYKTPQAISVHTIAAGLDPFSLTKNKIVIRSIKIDAPDITFEGDPFSGNNLSTIRDNIVGVQRAGGPAGVSTNAVATTPSKPGKKFEVDDFVIAGAKVHAVLTGMNGKELTVTIPNIELKDLGKDKEGITVADLTRRVLDTLSTTAVKAVAAAVAEQAGNKNINQIKKELNNLIGK